MNNSTNKQLSFRVSSGLKNIIGKDLISDKFIAVFELVKNSYDAGAHKVIISFENTEKENSTITIYDDGIGMSYKDIVNKWLFVAYSEKKKRNLDDGFREKIKRNVAGAKGVGRFSCDRLGSQLTLVTKSKEDDFDNVLDIDWDKFEYDDSQDFINIPVQYRNELDISQIKSTGTILKISNLREKWDRQTILRLKRSLMKLISPEMENTEDPFSIEFNVPEMLEDDKKIHLSKSKKDGWERNIVNGPVINDVFEKLNIKTTSIQVQISESGKEIETTLYDRGEFIFKFCECNREYTLLNNIHINLFYMNRSAKTSFTKQMGGVQPVNYGSVFIYKNGFRVNPYGDPGEDFFNINQRKVQGYNRNLGTREIMGRITINGDNEEFVETSSRAHGFISTPSVHMLSEFFLQKVLKVLERYVVNIISWGEPLKSNPNHTIMPLEVPEQIINEFADISRRSDLISIDYNPLLLTNNAETSNEDSLIASISKLEKVAQKSNNDAVINLARSVKSRTEEILNQNLNLEKENEYKERELKKARLEQQTREKQIFFLKSLAENDSKNLISGMHMIYTSTEVARNCIEEIKPLLEKVSIPESSELFDIFMEIEKANRKANKIAELAINGTKNIKQTAPQDIAAFVEQYLKTNMVISGIQYSTQNSEEQYICVFDPISVGIIIDNVASNSKKAKATKVSIIFSQDENFVRIRFIDDGIGLNPNINPVSLFEYGVSANSTQKGFGIGLNHIKELVEEMGGTTKVNTERVSGFELEVSIKK